MLSFEEITKFISVKERFEKNSSTLNPVFPKDVLADMEWLIKMLEKYAVKF